MLSRFLKRSTWIFLLVIACSCGDLNIQKDSDGLLSAQTEIEFLLIPANFPIFPTALTMDSLKPYVVEQIKSYKKYDKFNVIALPVEAKITGAIDQLNSKLTAASQKIIQPATLSASIKERITNIKKVEITDVELSARLANKTKDFVAMPASFSLYIGSKEQVDQFDEQAKIPFHNRDGQQEVIVPDKSVVKMKTDSIPELAAHLTKVLQGESSDLAVNYKLAYRVADTSNHADPQSFVKKMGLCLAALSGFEVKPFFSPNAAKDCPPPKDLAAWHVEMENLSIKIKVKAEFFEVDQAISCKGFADKYGLDILKNVCPK